MKRITVVALGLTLTLVGCDKTPDAVKGAQGEARTLAPR